MKSKKIDKNLLTIEDMSDKTGLSKKSLFCAIKSYWYKRLCVY